MTKLYVLMIVALLVSGCSHTPTPLIQAALEGRTAEVKRLVETGADLNEQGSFPLKQERGRFSKSTPLMAAAYYGRNDTIDMLLSLGADVNEENSFCVSPLFMAVSGGNKETVSHLLAKGARLDRQSPPSAWCHLYLEPLQIAASDGDLEMVKLLVRRGAPIDAGGYCGYTPLLLAAQKGDVPVVEYLLKNGAAPAFTSSDKLGCNKTTPLKLAKERRHAEVVRLLTDAAAGAIPLRRVVAAQPEDPAEEAAFQAVVERLRRGGEIPAFPEEARKYKAQAEFAFERRQLEDAEALYGKALKLAPWWPEGRFNRALLLGELSRYEEAIREMKKYLVLAPAAPDARAAQDRIYQWEGMVND